MSKIKSDKYYTNKELALYCINKTYEIIGEENISETIEPSAGDGSFSEQIYHNVCWAYDIVPEHPNIIKQDFLKLDVPYLYGRLIIGNPPYGERMYMAQQFYKKSIHLGDYIAFILPISQLWNTNSLYEFDLIYSEDLGRELYTDRYLHCCFNIYKRPESGELNIRPSNKLKDITIIRQDSTRYKTTNNYDIRMCYWGDGSAGKILKEGENYSAEYKIIIHNDKIKNNILQTLYNIDWHKELNNISMLKIHQFQIINLLKKYIPEIQ